VKRKIAETCDEAAIERWEKERRIFRTGDATARATTTA